MARLGWIVAGLLSLLLIAALALGVAAFSISRGWQRETLRDTLETLLADSLGDEVSIGGIEGPLLPSLTVLDLRVGSAGAPTLAIDQLELRIAWRRSLASRTLVLRKLGIRGAHLSAFRDEAGAWDLPDWLSGIAGDDDALAAEPDEPSLIQVDRSEIEDLSLRIGWRGEAGEAAILVTGSATLGPLPAATGETAHGSLRAHARGEGVATRWLDEARLEADFDGPRIGLAALELTGGGRPALRLAQPAGLLLGDEQLRFEQLELRSDSQALVLNGAVSAERFHDLEVDLRDLDLALAGELAGSALRPAGRVTGELRLDGPFLQPEGSVELVWSEPRLADWQAERLSVRASGDGNAIRLAALEVDGAIGGPLRLARPALLRIRDDSIEIEDFELRSAGQAIVANGRISGDRFHDLRLQVRALDVGFAGRLLELAGEPDGQLDGELQLNGAFAQPTGRVDLRWSEPQLAGWRGERIDLLANLDGERLQLSAHELRAGTQPLALELEVPASALERALAGAGPRLPAALPDGLRARLRSDGLSLATLAPLLPESLPDLQGQLSSDLELVGGATFEVRGHLELSDGILTLPGRDPIEGLHARLDLRPEPGGFFADPLLVEVPELVLHATGPFDFDGPRALELALAVPDLAAFSEVHALAAPLVGAFEAHTSLRGDWIRPGIQGTANWTHPAPDLTHPHRIDLELASTDRDLIGQLSVFQETRVAAQGELRVPYGESGIPGLVEAAEQSATIELRADDFDLASVAPLLPRYVRDLRGRADLGLSLQGGTEQPSLTGTLQVREGSVHVPAARQTFAPIAGSASFRDDSLHIERLRVGSEGAHADISGDVRLGAESTPAELDLGLAFVRLPIARSRPLTTDVDGQLRVQGALDALRIEGTLALSETRVHLVQSGDATLREIVVISSDADREQRREMREREQRRDAFDRAAVDVAVTVPRNSWVRGRGAALDVTGALRLEKNPGNSLRISGQVDTVRGTYRFQGKRFDIRRGAVSFEGSADLDPLLDIEATHRVRDITIVIVLSGRASDPIVTLSSEPTMSEDDVLSYLFFGRSTSKLGSKQPTGSLDRAATALAAGIALQEASRLVEDALPVDTIDVRIEEDGSSGDVGVGKYLTNDLFVRYERGFGTTATDGVRIEMRLSDQWSVETEASSDESAGADLVWSFDY